MNKRLEELVSTASLGQRYRTLPHDLGDHAELSRAELGKSQAEGGGSLKGDVFSS